MSDLYAILEVDRNATQEDIKRSYRRLALRYHPDKAGPEGASRFKQVNHAFGVLSDPKKKVIYDNYGEAGLNSMENPVAGAALAAVGYTSMLLIIGSLVVVCTMMILLFLVFLVSFVDGKLHGWSFVKVFAPLFVLDFLVGILSPVFWVALIVISPFNLLTHTLFLASLSAIALTIVIPIAKDRNEANARAGIPDRLQWRLLLLPGYLFSLCVLLLFVIISFPTKGRILRLKSMGLVNVVRYTPVGFLLNVVQGLCLVVFFVLVACRADGVIEADYLAVVGLPIFVLLTLFLVNRLAYSFLSFCASDVSFEATQAQAEGEDNAHGGERAAQHPDGGDSHGPCPSRPFVTNPMSAGSTEEHDSTHAHVPKEREERQDRAGDGAQSSHENDEPQSDCAMRHSPEGGGSSSADGKVSACCIVVSVLLFLIVGLLAASVAMIAVRLNYKSRSGSYDGAMSLSTACIPFFLIIGTLMFFELIMLVALCCCGAIIVEESDEGIPGQGDPPNGNTENDEELQRYPQGDTEFQAAGTTFSAPRQDGGANSRPAVAGFFHAEQVSVGQHAASPPEHQPDNQRLSDVD